MGSTSAVKILLNEFCMKEDPAISMQKIPILSAECLRKKNDFAFLGDYGSISLLSHNTLKLKCDFGTYFFVQCWWPRESVLQGSSVLCEFCTSLSKVLTRYLRYLYYHVESLVHTLQAILGYLLGLSKHF